MKGVTQYAIVFERGEKDVTMVPGIEVDVERIDHMFFKITNSAGDKATVTEHAFKFKD
jgi:hypothetical protein